MKFKVDSCFQRTNPVLRCSRKRKGSEKGKPQREPEISSLVQLLAVAKVEKARRVLESGGRVVVL